ncbi:Beta-glucanase [Paramyrothecium foliicola]|nr:Beta-glucanase [Paramyrothecium foliicola]
MKPSATFLAAGLATTAYAFVPNVDGMNTVWSDAFEGCAGCTPDLEAWTIGLDIHVNNEVQDYSDSSSNLQLSGGDTLQLVPWKDDAGKWTSGRLESKQSWTPQPGKKFQVQGEVRVGSNAQKQGIWPAFWLLGDAIRNGTPWPTCGELDIFEQVNGLMTGHGTVHCGTENGGPCNEPFGRTKTVPIPDNEFHTWGIAVDRTSGDWQTESITWLFDGVGYHTLTGAELGDEGIWATLAHSPYYMIVNVAVGGNWPVSQDPQIHTTACSNLMMQGPPTDGTEDGYGAMLEVNYVAVYESA